MKINDIVLFDALIKTSKNSEVILSTKNQKFKIEENQMIKIYELLKKVDKSQKYLKINKIKSKLSKLFIKKSRVIGGVTATAGVRGDEVDTTPGIQWSDDLEDESSGSSISSNLKKAKEYYSKEEYNLCISVLNPNIDKLKDKEKMEGLFLIGTSYFQTGNFNKSIESFLDLLKYKKTDLNIKEAALYLVSLAYNYVENYQESIKYLEILKREFPKNPSLPEIYFLLGNSYKIIGNTEKAKSYFKFIIDNFSKSSLFKEAEKEYNDL